MKLGVAGGWGGGSLFFWSPLTLLAENSDGAALLSRAGPELSHASPTELVKDKSSPWVPLEKAGDGAWLPHGDGEVDLRLDSVHQTVASFLPFQTGQGG